MTHRFHAGDPPGRRPWLGALLCIAALAPVRTAAAQTSDETQSSDGCALARDWKSNFRDLTLGYATPSGALVDVPICEPVALSAAGMHFIHLDLQCGGCGDEANRFIEMFTNIRYLFVVRDGGLLTRLANDTASMTGALEQQAVLYHPPEWQEVGTTETYHVDVYSSSLDAITNPNKPPNFLLHGVYTIQVTRKLAIDQVTLADGKVVERRRELNDFVIQTQGDSQYEPPGFEDPAEECWPNWTWYPGAPITGTCWMGEQGAPLTELNERDIVTLSAEAMDVDALELRCEQLHQCGPDMDNIILPDTLLFAWSATAGTFIGPTTGRTVVYQAPEDPGTPVSIQLTISNAGGQAFDQPLTLPPITFVTGMNRKYLEGALVSTIDAFDTTPPNPGDTPPAAAPTWTPMPEAYMGNYTRFNAASGVWELGGKIPIFGFHTHLMDVHPWHKATEHVQTSSNPPPAPTFADIDAVAAFMKSKEYRHVHAVHCVAVVRRDVILEIVTTDPQVPVFNMRVIQDTGYTPTRGTTPAAQAAAIVMLGRRLRPFEKGLYLGGTRKVYIENEFRSAARVRMTDTFRVGNDMNDLQARLTNRLVPWQPAEFRATVPATRDILPTDAAATGNFPTHWPYINVGTGVSRVMSRLPRLVPIPYAEFLDRYGRIDPRKI